MTLEICRSAAVLVAWWAVSAAGAGAPPRVMLGTVADLATGSRPTGLVAVDVDADGDSDLVCANRLDASFSVFLNDGAGHFAPGVQAPIGQDDGRPVAVVAADLDDNALADLVLAVENGDVAMMVNQGALRGSVPTFIDIGWGIAPEAVAVAAPEFNATGSTTVVGVRRAAARTQSRIGTGNGIYQGIDWERPTGAAPSAIAVGHFNSDSAYDYAVANTGAATVQIELWVRDGFPGSPGEQPRGVETVTSQVISVGTRPVALAVGDVNSDGRDDLAVACYGDNSVRILLGNGAGGFVPGGSPLSIAGPVAIAAGDINLDGRPDLVVGGNAAFGSKFTGIGTLPGTPLAGEPIEISDDGSVVIGNSGADGFIWRVTTGVTRISGAASGLSIRLAGMTPDAHHVLAEHRPAGGNAYPVIYHDDGTTEPLPLPAGTVQMVPVAVDATGDIVLCNRIGSGNPVMWLWRRGTGFEPLESYLTSQGVPLEGWTFGSAWSMSDDAAVFLVTSAFSSDYYLLRRTLDGAWCEHVCSVFYYTPFLSGDGHTVAGNTSWGVHAWRLPNNEVYLGAAYDWFYGNLSISGVSADGRLVIGARDLEPFDFRPNFHGGHYWRLSAAGAIVSEYETSNYYPRCVNTDGSHTAGTVFGYAARDGATLTDSSIFSAAAAVSGDGRTVFGKSRDGVANVAVAWTEDLPLARVLGPGQSGVAVGASRDGRTVVVAGVYSSVRRNPDGTTSDLSAYPVGNMPQVRGISGDGAVAVGRANANFPATGSVGVIWRPQPQAIGTEANAASFDGSVVVGAAAAPGGQDACRWTLAGGVQLLGAQGVIAGGTNSRATDVSADGAIAVGYTQNASGQSRGFRHSSGSITPIPDLPGGADRCMILSCDENALVLVGSGTTAAGERALIWDAELGVRDLSALLTSLGQPLSGWTLVRATGVSDDGRTICGEGFNPNGETEGWVAILPTLQDSVDRLTILVNTTEGASSAPSFGGRVEASPGPSVRSVAVADYDGDSRPDIAVVRELADRLVVLRNLAAQAPYFRELISSAPGLTGTFAPGLSADGNTVAGYAEWSDGSRTAVKWTLHGGMTILEERPGGAVDSWLEATSSDGSVSVGRSSGPAGLEAARWGFAGVENLGDLTGGEVDSRASGVSADGGVVVGRSAVAGGGVEAFRWLAGTGLQSLGDLPGGAVSGVATAVSSDGTTVVGRGTSSRGPEAFIWRSGTGFRALGDLPAGPFNSAANDLSDSPVIVVGRARGSAGNTPVMWDDETAQITELGAPGDPDSNVAAYAVSADGRVIVGRARIPLGADAGQLGAFVWNSATGVRSVREVLAGLGVNMSGWQLTQARAVSDDGTVVAGNGVNPAGQLRAWVAVLPPPSLACPCDWNRADGLDSQDFFDFLDAFFNSAADFNGVDGTDSQDFFDFLDCFFIGCE